MFLCKKTIGLFSSTDCWSEYLIIVLCSLVHYCFVFAGTFLFLFLFLYFCLFLLLFLFFVFIFVFVCLFFVVFFCNGKVVTF